MSEPKDLRKHCHFVDDIIPIVTGLYDRKFRLSGLSRKMQNNMGMHKSRDMWRQRKHAKPHYTSCDIRQGRVASPGPRARAKDDKKT